MTFARFQIGEKRAAFEENTVQFLCKKSKMILCLAFEGQKAISWIQRTTLWQGWQTSTRVAERMLLPRASRATTTPEPQFRRYDVLLLNVRSADIRQKLRPVVPAELEQRGDDVLPPDCSALRR